MRLIRDLRENEVKKEQADGDDGEECPGDDALAVAAAKGIAFLKKSVPEPDPRGQAGKAEDGVSVAAGEAEYRATGIRGTPMRPWRLSCRGQNGRWVRNPRAV